MPLDPQIAALLSMLEAPGVVPIHAGTPEAGRASFRALTCGMVTPDQVVPVGKVEDLTVRGAAGDLPARLYRPEGTGPWPTVLYLHGGGFVIGDLDTHDQTCRRLTRDADVVVLSVAYRLAPEHPYPAGPEDAKAAAAWAADHLPELGGDDRLAVAGDSAGGNLAAIVAQTMPDRLAAQILIYPSVDPLVDYPSRHDNAMGYFLDDPTMAWFSQHYVGTDLAALDLTDPRLVPMLGDVTGGPPAVVVTAEFDPLRDEGEAYAAKLAAAGVGVDAQRYDGLIHGFLDMVGLSSASAEAATDLHARVRRVLHGEPS
ncbi:MAG: alpha/beta hydrolase [Nocardioidaceae bacterium]|nr:alpha/beta hydrolase [Nocardioidaceae bacterium]